MKIRFILFRHGNIYYCEDTTTHKQQSLCTRDKSEALTLLHSKNEAHLQLGELADLNPKYIGEVERMEKTISVDGLARIASALKVRLRDLLHEA